MNFSGVWESVVLGIIQGIAEFLPISSSGHLVLAQELLGIDATPDESSSTGLAMNVALHVGTLFSIVLVYWSDLRLILRNWQLCRAIVIATLPVVVVGLTLKDPLERAFESPLVASVGLLVTSLVLTVGHRREHQEIELDRIDWRRALQVGCSPRCQTLADRIGSHSPGNLARAAAGTVAHLPQDARKRRAANHDARGTVVVVPLAEPDWADLAGMGHRPPDLCPAARRSSVPTGIDRSSARHVNC